MSVVRRIEAVATGNRNGMQNVPLEPVLIEHVEVLGAKKLPCLMNSGAISAAAN